MRPVSLTGTTEEQPMPIYMRLYETQNPEHNSAIGPPNLTMQGMGTLLHGKMIMKFRDIAGSVEPGCEIVLSDGSILQITIPPDGRVDIDLLKKTR
jgi:hypothetical protein